VQAPALLPERLAASIADPLLALGLGENNVLLLKGCRSRSMLGGIDALLSGQRDQLAIPRLLLVLSGL
jgi:hypothetical protein